MSWFIVVYFLVNGAWIEADKLGKEGWSAITQPSYEICIDKINDSNQRFKKIAEYRQTELNIKFKCECRKNLDQLNIINCKPRNLFQKFWDKIFLIK